MRDRPSTAQASAPILVVALVLVAFAWLVSALQLGLLATLLSTPIAVGLALVAARIQRGSPATLRGIRQSGRAPSPAGSTAAPAKARRPRYQLVAMPVNHYGEKLRWILDLVGAPYEESTVGGILSAGFRGRSVPWLVDRWSCSVIGNSDEAVAYLGAVHVPTIDDDARRERCVQLLQRTPAAIAWESKLSLLGHAVQGWAYFYLLKRGAGAVHTLRAWGAYEPRVPVFERWVIRLWYPLFRVMLRRAFVLGSDVQRDRRLAVIEAVMDEVDVTLAKQPFLTGESLSYVDVTFAALAAPLVLEHVLLSEPSLYANGRFVSFARRVDEPVLPPEILAMQERLMGRACGRFVRGLFLQWRGRGA